MVSGFSSVTTKLRPATKLIEGDTRATYEPSHLGHLCLWTVVDQWRERFRPWCARTERPAGGETSARRRPPWSSLSRLERAAVPSGRVE